MTITIKTKAWTVIVESAESKSEWIYTVKRGKPTTKEVEKALKSILKFT